MDVLGSDEDALEAALGLGELAGLTVTNEADAYDVRTTVRCVTCFTLLLVRILAAAVD